MQKANFVSLWFGNLQSRRAMEKYLKIKDSKDGDFILSEFARDFNIKEYNDNCREAEFIETPTKNIEGFLKSFSYDKVLIEYLKGLSGENLDQEYNAAILLFNFDYDGSVPEVNDRKKYFKFIGSTQYRENKVPSYYVF